MPYLNQAASGKLEAVPKQYDDPGHANIGKDAEHHAEAEQDEPVPPDVLPTNEVHAVAVGIRVRHLGVQRALQHVNHLPSPKVDDN